MDIPAEIGEILQGRPFLPVTPGFSGAEIRRYPGEPDLYLKMMPKPANASLRHEAEVMIWLRGKLPVPEVLAFAVNPTAEFLLMTALTGNSFLTAGMKNPTAAAAMFAAGLRQVHSVPIQDCPLDMRAEKKIQLAQDALNHGLVKPEYFSESRRGLTAESLRPLLLSARIPNEDLVFTHGDYCFPNVFIQEGKTSGFLDFNHGGVADRYQDLATGARSLYYNVSEVFHYNRQTGNRAVETFFEAYGLDRVDEEKIRFYRLLDDFFR